MNLEQALVAMAIAQKAVNEALAGLQAQLGPDVDVNVERNFFMPDSFVGPAFEVVVKLRASA